jgi:chromosomal replication initiation ATPase DnaA
MALDIIGHINQEVTTLTLQQKQDMLDDYTEYFGYSDTLEDGSVNLETKKEFANRMIEKHIRDIVKSVRKRRAEAQVTYEELEL